MPEVTLLHTNYIFVVGSVLLASSVFFFSQFLFATIATPIESSILPDVSVKAPLIARAKATYSGTDTNINASLAGTYNCYNDGTWARQTEIDIPINYICGEPVHDVPQFTPFSFIPNADGAYNPQVSVYQLSWRCFDVSSNCDSTPKYGDYYLYFNGDDLTPAHANAAACEYALGRARDLCHGDNGYTRGGWFTYTDGTSYGFDPQKNGKNQ